MRPAGRSRRPGCSGRCTLVPLDASQAALSPSSPERRAVAEHAAVHHGEDARGARLLAPRLRRSRHPAATAPAPSGGCLVDDGRRRVRAGGTHRPRRSGPAPLMADSRSGQARSPRISVAVGIHRHDPVAKLLQRAAPRCGWAGPGVSERPRIATVRMRRRKASISGFRGVLEHDGASCCASVPSRQPGRVVMRCYQYNGCLDSLRRVYGARVRGGSGARPKRRPEAAGGRSTAAEPAAPVAPFKYQTGDIVLPNKVATLHLGEKYRYLDPAETNKLLMAWGNPPDDETQGAIVPADVDPLTRGRLGRDPHLRRRRPRRRLRCREDRLRRHAQGHEGRHRGQQRRAQEGGLRRRCTSSAGPSSRATTPPRRNSTGRRNSISRAATRTRSTTTCACWAAKACCR